MQSLARIVLIVLLAGVACALLARFAPGSTVDERELNQKAGEDTIAALRARTGGPRSRMAWRATFAVC